MIEHLLFSTNIMLFFSAMIFSWYAVKWDVGGLINIVIKAFWFIMAAYTSFAVFDQMLGVDLLFLITATHLVMFGVYTVTRARKIMACIELSLFIWCCYIIFKIIL